MENVNQAAETETTAAATDTAAAAEPKVKEPGVGDKAKELIRAGLGNKEVLEGIKAAFPDSKASMASVNWYRNNLRQLGENVKTARELSAASKPTQEEKDAAKQAKKDEAKKAREAKATEKKAEKEAAKKAAAEAKAAAKATDAGAEVTQAEAGEAGAAGEGEGEGFLA